jgi:hypothetical protein
MAAEITVGFSAHVYRMTAAGAIMRRRPDPCPSATVTPETRAE